MRNDGKRLLALLLVAVATAGVLFGLSHTGRGTDLTAYAPGEECSRILRAALPADLSAAGRVQLTDTLDHRLALRGGVLVSVTGQGDDTHRAVLEDGVDYWLDIGTAQDVHGYAVDTVTLTLTAAGMEQAAALQTAGSAELHMYIVAIVKDLTHPKP
ncbi:MAG: isopeptide-forming domain-containing fimbrial protein [Clostridia bacterium]|nr:isopeptide-forming domain-containing fimbrial protein [Clostridia bacterium]